MLKWFNETLNGFEQTLFVIGSIAILLLTIQLIILIIGMGFGDSDFDTADGIDDLDSINDGGFVDLFGLKLVTVRGIVAFFGIGAWTALSISQATDTMWLAILIGCVAGFIAAVLLAYVMKKAMDLQYEGTVAIENCIGKRATVYIPIPPVNQGNGKVSVTVQERFYEFDAVQHDDLTIPTHTEVVVIAVVNNNLVVKVD